MYVQNHGGGGGLKLSSQVPINTPHQNITVYHYPPQTLPPQFVCP